LARREPKGPRPLAHSEPKGPGRLAHYEPKGAGPLAHDEPRGESAIQLSLVGFQEFAVKLLLAAFVCYRFCVALSPIRWQTAVNQMSACRCKRFVPIVFGAITCVAACVRSYPFPGTVRFA